MSSASQKASSSLIDAGQRTGVPRGFVSDSIAAGVIFALVLTIGQRVIGFGRGLLFCRLMTDQQLGQWSMAWSYLMLLAPLAVLGLPGCFGKFTEYFLQRGQLKSFIVRITWISSALTLLMSGVIFALPEQFAWFLFRDVSQAGLVRLLAIALLVVTASNFVATLMESLRQVRTVTLMRFISGVMFAVVGAALLLVWSDGAAAATVAFAISCLVGMIPAFWVLWKYREGFSNDGESLTHSMMWKRIAPFAIWLWVSNLLNNLIEVADRYMLIHWSSGSAEMAQASVGQYHSGRVIPLLLISIAAMLAGVLMPYLSQAWEAGNKAKAVKQLNWTVKLISISFTVCGILILLLAPWLFDWVLQGRYNAGLSVLPLTIVYCIWFSLMTISQDYLWVAEKGKWATFVNLLGLFVNIVLNMILIPTIGLHGAVIATAAGNAALVVLMVTCNHRFGCKSDVGIWICVALPAVLLLSLPAAMFSVVGVGIICYSTNLILNDTEKSELTLVIREKVSGILGKR